MSNVTKILIIPGGGVFGVIPAYFLHCLGAKDLNSMIDVYGGTSVGSILAMAFAAGNCPTKVFKTFRKEVNSIFGWSWSRLLPLGAKFSNAPLVKMMKEFSPGKYSELKRTVIIPVTDFEYNTVKVYDNIDPRDDMDRNAWELPVESSAAPTYFPVFNGKIDGGLAENMPVITTTFALRCKAGIRFENMDILIIGTGWRRQKKRNANSTKYWTKAHWLPPLIQALTDANESTSRFWAAQLPYRSLRLFNPIEITGDMDDPDVVEDCIDKCRGHESEFEDIFKEFLDGEKKNIPTIKNLQKFSHKTNQ